MVLLLWKTVELTTTLLAQSIICFHFFFVFGACILNFNFLHRSTCADKEPVHVWAPSEADISNIREYEHILFRSTTDSKRERKIYIYIFKVHRLGSRALKQFYYVSGCMTGE